MNRHDADLEVLRRCILEAPGTTDDATRRAAFYGTALDPPSGPYLATVRDQSFGLQDADVDALRAAGMTEDAIFELTIAAAAGEAYRRIELGLAAVRGRG